MTVFRCEANFEYYCTGHLVTDVEDSRSFAVSSGKLPDYIFTLTPDPSIK
jgi:hypothetical protein